MRARLDQTADISSSQSTTASGNANSRPLAKDERRPRVSFACASDRFSSNFSCRIDSAVPVTRFCLALSGEALPTMISMHRRGQSSQLGHSGEQLNGFACSMFPSTIPVSHGATYTRSLAE